MTTAFGVELVDAIKKKEINVDFRGVWWLGFMNLNYVRLPLVIPGFPQSALSMHGPIICSSLLKSMIKDTKRCAKNCGN